MVEFIDLMFLFQFFVIIILFVIKLYNVISYSSKKKKEGGESNPLSMKVSFLVFIGFLLFYGIGFVTTLIGVDNVLMYQLFRLETFLLLPVVLFFIIELFMYLRDIALGYTSRTSYNSGGRGFK